MEGAGSTGNAARTHVPPRSGELMVSRLGLAHLAAPRPGRRVGLVFRSSSDRDTPYRRLAAIIGELISSEQEVHLVT